MILASIFPTHHDLHRTLVAIVLTKDILHLLVESLVLIDVEVNLV